MTEERLHKVLARAGVASLRASEALIAAGRVTVNGVAVTEPGARADPERDAIAVDGVSIRERGTLVYLALNKPAGVLTTASDERGRPTVASLLPEGVPRVYPVGRLDRDSEGLLLLTNDGELTHRLTHPRFEVEKEYLVESDRRLLKRDLERAVRGVESMGARLRVKAIHHAGAEDGRQRYLCVLTEGRKRELRRIFAAFGAQVLRLVRVREGPVRLGELAPGQTRPLTDDEIAGLRRITGLALPETPTYHRQKTAPRRPAPR